jgi:Cd2+/Zn2+-exporting ATPase
LVKGARFLEALNKVDTVIFDKTGTLTRGEFEVTRVDPAPGGEAARQSILETAAYAEWDSTHPISRSIKSAYLSEGGAVDPSRLSERTERAGFGVRALLDGVPILAGSARLLAEAGIDCHIGNNDSTFVEVAYDNHYIGRIVLSDSLKRDAAEAVRRLRGLGVREVAMLTGDTPAAAEAVRRTLSIDTVEANLLPHQKMESLERRMTSRSGKGAILFVGDGINDAPVLARADVGIAMGELGSDAALEAADAALMTDEPTRVAELIIIARRTRLIGIQNITLSLGVKAVLMVLGALGMTPLWLAVFGDVGVALLAVMNAMRAARYQPSGKA